MQSKSSIETAAIGPWLWLGRLAVALTNDLPTFNFPVPADPSAARWDAA
jgi:hypothetical protein